MHKSRKAIDAQQAAEMKDKLQWSGYGELCNTSQKPLQPTAEGAEEIPTAKEFVHKYYNLPQSKVMTVRIGSLIKCLERFATLHAQKIAEKMVEERLREELMRYDQWLLANDMGQMFDDTMKCVDEYLKQRQL